MGKKHKQKKQQQQEVTTSRKSENDHFAEYVRAVRSGQAAVKNIERRLSISTPKGIQFDNTNNVNYNNVVYPKDKIPDRLLRLCERRNGVVGAGTTLRIQQGVEYSSISHNKDIPGWEVVLKDEKEKISKERQQQKQFLEELIKNGSVEGYTSFNGNDVPSTFRERITQFMRDSMLIDKICWEIERDRKGCAVAIWVLDGATIYPVLPGGLHSGASSMYQSGLAGWNKTMQDVLDARIANMPEPDRVAFVQEIFAGMSGGGITAAFTNEDLIYDIANDINDIRYYKQGFSDTEKANVAVTAFINAISYNSAGLAKGVIPKIAVAMGKESGYTTEQMEDLQDEWMANFEGVEGQWNIPLLNADARILNLMPNNRDMEYQTYMEFCGSLVASILGFDPAEAGLRFNQAQNVLSENMDGKQKFSKNRGLSEKLGRFKYITDRFIEASGYTFAKDWTFRFNGLTSEDKNFEADLRKKAVETDTTVNELRKEKGMPPLDGGDIILNPQYIQYLMQSKQMEQQAQGGEGGDESGFNGFGGDEDGSDNGENGNNEESENNDDIDSIVEEAMNESDLAKAKLLI